MKPLNKHAQEMLALIASRSVRGAPGYWAPTDKQEYFTLGGKAFSVFVQGPWSTGAIRTLTSRGLVEIPAGSPHKWGRRITEKGRDVLEYYLMLGDFI